MKELLSKIKGIKQLHDQSLLLGFQLDDGSKFYLEHTFLTQLNNLINIHKDKTNLIVDKLVEIVKRNGGVLFVHDYDFPMVDVDGYVILEIEDILNPLQIFMEDKSRGSDYGD